MKTTEPISKPSTNGQAKSSLKVDKTKPKPTTEATIVSTTTAKASTELAEKRNRIHDLEGYCKQSLDKIGVLKILQEYSQKISELRNALKESSGEIKIVIFTGHEEQLRVAKPDVIEDLLLLLEDRNDTFMDQLIDEIIE